VNLFGNYKVVPFIASISLLILTYYITKELTKKRFAGIVALVLVLQSGTFFIYDTSITYDNYWIMFYLLSLYMIFKAWPFSHISFILSIFSKLLSILFVPMTIFLTLHAEIRKKTKILIISSYIGMITVGFFVTKGLDIDRILTALDWHDFWMALSGISYQMRYDGLILVLLLQVIVWSFYVAKKGIKSAQTAMVLILGSLLSQPLLAALTINSSEPYRFIPLVVFFAIASGVLLSKPKQNVST
jgi:4-amino-4-deoxy-L-arabinose transferase-like glycosyltransferase